MDSYTSSTLQSRDVSPDNAVNIAFGLASVLIGIVTIMFGWLMWKLKKKRGASTKSTDEDNSELLSAHICNVRKIVHDGDSFEVTLRLRRRSKNRNQFH